MHEEVELVGAEEDNPSQHHSSSIVWDRLVKPRPSGLSRSEPFNVHEALDSVATHVVHETHHHHHRPRHQVNARTWLLTQRRPSEVVRMINASEDLRIKSGLPIR